VPKIFAYFCAKWEGGGYTQIIEDVWSFPRGFSEDIVAGKMGANPTGFGRKSGHEAEGRYAMMAQAAEFGQKMAAI